MNVVIPSYPGPCALSQRKISGNPEIGNCVIHVISPTLAIGTQVYKPHGCRLDG
jgi:hypothetical protein